MPYYHCLIKMRATGQCELRFGDPRGGKRKGAGRKRAPGSKPRVRHVARGVVKPGWPVHVTLRMRDDAPRLRNFELARVLRRCFVAAKVKLGFRICQFSIQSNHIHLVCEATDRTRLTSGVQGFEVRIARAINRANGRTGKVLADRYHARALRTPREVKNVLAYVLQNHRHHGGRPVPGFGGIDPFTSSWWFDGWRDDAWRTGLVQLELEPSVAAPRSYLLRVGWRRHGLLAPDGRRGR